MMMTRNRSLSLSLAALAAWFVCSPSAYAQSREGWGYAVYQTAPGPDARVEAVTNDGEGDWRLIALPGAPSRFMDWRPLVLAAPSSLEAIVVNRPGYGESGPKAAVTGFVDQFDAILSLAEGRGDQCVVILGADYSAGIALQAALDHPDLIDAVVLVSPLITEPEGNFRTNVRKGLRRLGARGSKTAAQEMKAHAAQIGPTLDRAGELTAPTAILRRERDPDAPQADADTLARILRNEPELFVIENGGADLVRSRPDDVIAAVEVVMRRAEREGRCSPLSLQNG